ncbi:MAG: Hpt domain-containing protein, partial [Massilia sp.]|nr:Hpt domain-containing protein [Massilia sp.]
MSMDDEDLSRFSMLDLFRMETREQMRVLTDGLLQLEQGAADAAMLESMMRAAHSVKGAAAIVGLDPALRLAHAMEDVLVAAQEDRMQLDPDAVDVLLGAVDLLQQLADLPESDAGGADTPHGARLAELLAALAGLRGGARTAVPKAPPAPPPPSPPPAAPALPAPPAAAPAPVPAPVSAPAIAPAAGSDELATLAGQARLHAGQLRPWIASLQRYKRHQRGVFEALDQLQDAIRTTNDPHLAELAQLVADRAAPLREDLHRTIRDAENYERQALKVSTRLADEVLALRMCRFADGVHGLPRMVRDLARGLGKDVRVEIDGADTLVDRAVLARMEAPLNQLLRNAVDHGMEFPDERVAAGKPAHGTIRLQARHRGGMLALEVADDGGGVDPERIRAAAVRRQVAAPAFAPELSQAELMEFLFLPSFSLKDSANEISGRGVGLDVV